MLREAILATFGLSALAQLSGCATAGATGGQTSLSSGDNEQYEQELAAANQRVSGLERDLQTSNRQLETTQAQLSARNASTPISTDIGLFPPNAQPGMCYARVLLPAEYRTTSERIVAREAGERIEIIPARYETVQERVLIREAGTQIEVVPAVYENAEERVMIKPASFDLTEVPAEYNTVSEQVLERAAYTEWKRGPAATQAGNVLSETVTDTGEVMCLVEVPATYRTVTRQVLVRPASTRRVEIPAEYETVSRRVLARPATTREVAIPAEYGNVEATRLVSAAQERRIEIPAQYETVSSTAKISDEQLQWRSVVCEVNLTRPNIVALQTALNTAGYYRGPIDGIIGSQTIGASNAFAAERNLPGGSNYITLEVVDALGLSERIAGQ